MKAAIALLALFVTYVRVLGRSLGFPSDFRGPMAKQQRMWVVIAAALFMGLAPSVWRVRVPVQGTNPERTSDVDEAGVMALALVVIVLGCVWTAVRRLLTLGRALKERPSA